MKSEKYQEYTIGKDNLFNKLNMQVQKNEIVSLSYIIFKFTWNGLKM